MDKQLIERIAPLVLAAIDQSLAFPSPSEKIAISESITALVIARIDAERGKSPDAQELIRTAPPRIWLQVSDEPDDIDAPFPTQITDEITWSTGQCVACEVEYVRADLSAPTIPEGWPTDDMVVRAAETQEPVAWFAFADNNGPVPLELWGFDQKACKYAVLENARSVGWKGTVEGYLFQKGWTIKPLYAAPPPARIVSSDDFQDRVQPWMISCFGAEIAADGVERTHRFFEESAELAQSLRMPVSEAHQLVDYVYGRPLGEPSQEVGGVMVTLAALCLAHKLDMHAAGDAELARISMPNIMEKIRAKQAAKPKHSPLPQAIAHQPPAPCPACNDTGDVHSPDGEWRGECNCGAEKYAQLQRENDALQAKVTELSDLSVTHIMLDVVPGADGIGEEIYAKSVADVERVLSVIGERNEGLTSKVAEHAALIEQCETRLKSLENANDERARLTTSEAYCAALKADGMREALDDLDAARRNARKTLAAIDAHRGQP